MMICALSNDTLILQNLGLMRSTTIFLAIGQITMNGFTNMWKSITFLKLLCVTLTIPLLLINCKEDVFSPTPLKMALTAEDVGVTDAMIKFSAEYAELGGVTFQIQRDGQTLFSLTPPLLAQNSKLDTIVFVDSLSPHRSYTFKAYRMIATTAIDSSAPLTFTTMDTTSHNFTWQIDTLGDGNSSVLMDVAIINDTLAYAVGEIYKKDSTGNYETEPYNLAVWNGSAWILQKAVVYYLGSRVVPPLESIFAFSPTDIWLTSGYPIHGNGTSWTLYRLPDIGINASVSKIWGTSSSNIYFVGWSGNIVFFNGSSWRKIESGTNVNVKDLYGNFSLDNNSMEIICIASNGVDFPQGRELLKIEENKIVNLTSPEIPMDLNGIWFSSHRDYYVVGDGIYKKHGSNSNIHWKRVAENITRNYIEAIRGVNINDIFCSGDFGELIHFNGSGWKTFRTEIGAYNTVFRSIAQRNGFVITVGYQGNRSIAVRGYRL